MDLTKNGKAVKKKKAANCIKRLKEMYPEAICSLVYQKPYELLIATRLSAQCTDARVNIVTEKLFVKYTSLEELASANIEDIEEIIYPCGLYKTKARDIKGMANKIIEDFGGKLPDNIMDLLSLPGVGRKTANLIMGDVFKKPAIVTDTHCIRITNRLGLVDSENPQKVEEELLGIIPPEEGNDLCHRFVLFGRDICTARSPKCANCSLADMCEVTAQQ